MSVATVIGLLIDASLGGIAVAQAFQEFQKSRPADETPEESAQEFAKEMAAQLVGEAEADDALSAWRAKHG